MRHINIFNRIRTALSLTPLMFLILTGLLFIMPARALAQETNSNDKIEALSKKFEELEKQIKELKRENSELKMRLDTRDTPKVAPAAETKTPKPVLAVETKSLVEETREATIAQQGDEPQEKEKRLEFGGQIRLRYEFRDDNPNVFFIRDAKSLVFQRTRLHAKAKLTDDISGFVEIQDARVWGDELASFFGAFNVDLHQAYIDVNHFLTEPLSLRVGRQELSYGSERLIGVFDWDNEARAFDAVKAVYDRKRWSADIFAARILDSGLLYQNFYGTYLKFFNDKPDRKLEFYGLVLRDNVRRFREGGNEIINGGTIYTVGTRQEAKSDSGFYYEGEIAAQTGHFGPDDHRALALAVRVGKSFESARSTHFGFEYDFATGDGNFGDRKSHEFIDLFADNHTHYGYMDFLGWRNMHDFRINFGFNPTNKLAFDADYHKFLLHREGGRWTSATGVTLGFNPFGTSGRNIGQELDFTFSFPYKERLKLLAGYSVFFPGRFAKSTRGSNVSHLSYIQALIDF